MKMADTFFTTRFGNVLLLTVLTLVAAVSYGSTIFRYPLVDYDEATYAKVVVDTMKSGDITTFKLGSRDWFEKPPLYLWLAVGSTKMFGLKDFAFRVPSVLASVVCLLLVFLILQELTRSPVIGAVGFLTLLFTPPFFVFAREARLDSSVIMAILTALFFYLKGVREQKYLFWIFPAIALGFLFKSVIVLLAGPILCMYAVASGEWRWLKSGYLWAGLFASFVVIAPWHILQSIRFGTSFWDAYLVQQVFHRATSTLTGTNNYYDYISIIWTYYQPWLWVIVAVLFSMTAALFSKQVRSVISWPALLPPLLSASFILIIFTLARTHLSTYIMPMYPFLAMAIALAAHQMSARLGRGMYFVLAVFIALVGVGAFRSFQLLNETVLPFHAEEKEVGQIYQKHNSQQAPLYALDWNMLETLSYYAGTTTQYLDPVTGSNTILKAPFYLVTNTLAMRHFLENNGDLLPEYMGRLQSGFIGSSLILLYSNQDTRLPVFDRKYVY